MSKEILELITVMENIKDKFYSTRGYPMEKVCCLVLNTKSLLQIGDMAMLMDSVLFSILMEISSMELF